MSDYEKAKSIIEKNLAEYREGRRKGNEIVTNEIMMFDLSEKEVLELQRKVQVLT